MIAQRPILFDHVGWRRMRERAATDFANVAFLKELACARLSERLEIVQRNFTDILDYGCHNGEMGQALPTKMKSRETSELCLSQCDISPTFVAKAAITNPFASHNFVLEDELLPLISQSYDGIVSALYLHWVNHLPQLLIQMRRCLRPDGLLLANFVGGRSLTELRTCLIAAESEICGGAQPRCIPMIDIKDAGALLQKAGFALPVIDSEILRIEYSDLFSLY